MGTTNRTYTHSVLAELRGPLAQRVRGSGSLADFYRVVLGLLYLHRVVPVQLARLTADSSPTEAPQLLLERIARLLSATLRSQQFPTGLTSALSAIRPASCQDILRLVQLVGELIPGDFEAFLRQLESVYGPPAIGPVTPATVTSLMARLTVGDNVSTVYDPCSRAGELLISASRYHDNAIDACADSPGADLVAYTGMNLHVQGVPGAVRQQHAPWTCMDREAIADAVLCNPPFNASGGPLDREPLGTAWPFGVPPRNSQNYAWLQHSVIALRPGGRAVVLLPPSTLWSAVPSERTIRANMVEARVIECIITLPKNMFNSTAIAPVAWVLRPRGEAPDHITFVIADHLGKRLGRRAELSPDELDQIIEACHRKGGALAMAVPLQAIRDNRCSLNPGDYRRKLAELAPADTAAKSVLHTTAAFASLRSEADEAAERAASISLRAREATPSSLPNGWRYMLLRDICEIQAGPSSSRLRSNERTPAGTVPVVMPKHLRDGRIIAIDDDKVSRQKAESLDRFRLQAGDLVCVRTGSLGKVALVDPSQAGWIPHTNLLRLRVHQHANVDPRYLMTHLMHEAVRDWINDRAAAVSPVPSLSTEALGELGVEIPPPEEQIRLLEALAALAAQTAVYGQLARVAADCQSALTRHLLRGTLEIR